MVSRPCILTWTYRRQPYHLSLGMQTSCPHKRNGISSRASSPILQGYYKVIMWSRAGPTPIHLTLTPTNFSMYSM